MAPLCTPTVNGFGRFRPNALAPVGVQWGRDNRGAMLRVVGAAGDDATRIENRIGEPMANPYLYLAAQVHAGFRSAAGSVIVREMGESMFPSLTRSIGRTLFFEGGLLQTLDHRQPDFTALR